jgi:hypothetical protein
MAIVLLSAALLWVSFSTRLRLRPLHWDGSFIRVGVIPVHGSLCRPHHHRRLAIYSDRDALGDLLVEVNVLRQSLALGETTQDELTRWYSIVYPWYSLARCRTARLPDPL